MKKNTKHQIIAAVMAVLLTASLGTAALASSEPSGDPPAAITQSIGNERPDTKPSDAPAIPDGERPSGEPSQQPSGEPGEMPSGEPGEMPSGEPGEMPSGEPGEMPSGEPGEMPGGEARQPSGEKDHIDLRSFLQELIGKLQALLGIGQKQNAPAQSSPAFDPNTGAPSGERNAPGEAPDTNSQNTPPADDQNQASGEMGQASSGEMGQPSGEMGGASGEAAGYTATNTLTENASGTAYSSTADGENAVLVSGSDVTLTGVTVTKTGSSSGDSADFYGVNAGVLAKDGATLTITDAEITTDGTHANGVFSYGSGTTVNISDSTITTDASNSGGIMTTGGATLNAENLTVNTSDNSSAAIRSDRGGGTVTVREGSYAASGVGSPAIYSTADITVSDAALTATNSEAVVIEGGNSVTLVNSDVSGNNAKLNGQSTVKTNVLIYQSMSGDAAEGSSSFTMTGGSMTAGTGAMFHVTNVTTTINLSGVDFTYAADSDVFLDASADAWGTTGKNGGNVTLNLDGQEIVGIIKTDSASTVAVNMKSGSTWTLTGDSYVTSLSGDTSGIDLNGCTLYVNGVAWNG